MPKIREGLAHADIAPALHDDLLYGAAAIARFVFGDERRRRRVYDLADQGDLPVFRMGDVICLRKSRYIAFIEARELRDKADDLRENDGQSKRTTG